MPDALSTTRRSYPGVIHHCVTLVAALLLTSCGHRDTPVDPAPPPPPIAEADTLDPAPPPPLIRRALTLEPIASGFDSPLYLTAPVGDSRLFVVERKGTIRVLAAATRNATTFLDLSPLVDAEGPERGMLSIAFDPRYAQNGKLYVAYAAHGGDLVVSRYEVSAATPDAADPATELQILRIQHLNDVHYGGQLAFGADGMLYISTGDGGGDGDSEGNAQNVESLLGKILRIDVSAASPATPYTIPRTNPFVHSLGVRGEIWALGLRNPWRMSFDPVSRQLYIADVGERDLEELNVVSSTSGGYNFGWNRMEGTGCFDGSDDCPRTGLTLPEFVYAHADPCTAITGGYVYRGAAAPEHQGRYFFADYCQGWIRSILRGGDHIGEYIEWESAPGFGIQSFGVDGKGELYVLQSSGAIWRIGPER